MYCPVCGGQNSRVLESRIAVAGDAMRRRRECMTEGCYERFTTYERVEQPQLLVIKQDGRTEPFSASKLLRGLAVACSKRRVPVERLEMLVSEVETQLRSRGRKEIASDDIGELALNGLVRIDEAAAIRFASVIERAESLKGFRQVLDRMAQALLEETTSTGLGVPDDEVGAKAECSKDSVREALSARTLEVMAVG